MAFSLSNWFKGKPYARRSDPADEKSAAAPCRPSAAPRRPPVPYATVRTVVPNSVQPVSLRDPSARRPRVAADRAPPVRVGRVRVMPGPRARFPSAPRHARDPAAPEPAAPPSHRTRAFARPSPDVP